MADEIKLKAPTVEQQVVVNINGEEKLRSFADTLEKISNNKNLQKYWKTQQELINATADAYGNFSKKASQDNAKELIKVTNALKAMSGTDLSNILPDFDKISKAMAEAQKVAGNIDSAFSIKGFKEAFDSFETLKAYGVDIQNLFSHFGVSSDVGELQKNVRALEGEVEKLTRRLTNAKNANEELRNEFDNFKSGSGFADKLDELDNLKSEMSYLREQAEETFRQFLKLNNITEDGYDRDGFYDDNRFKEYFQNIKSGYLSASDAIQQFKREYSYLLDDSFKSNNDTFGLEQLQAFSNKLDSIFRQVEETSTKINDIISNGVITKSVENLSMDSSLSDSQRSLFGNLLQDEESLKSITALFQKLIEESNKTSKVDLFNDEQLQQVLSIFDRIENSLSSLRSVISDVANGEEFSPLLKALNDIKEAASNIKLNFNMDLGDEVSERLNQKVSQASARQLEAYRKLFSAMKGTGKTNKEMLKFFEPDEASVTELIGMYQGIIKRAEEKFKVGNSNVYKKILGAEYDALKREITNANKQLSRADSKRSENGILGDLFGNTKDLSEVIEQLNKIVSKLDEISSSASEFKNVFKEGFNVIASVEEIDKLTNRVKELEDELSKIKLNPVNVDKSNISSDNSNVEVSQNDEVVASIRKKKEELASYELQLEETRYEIEKLSKAENESFGFKKAYSNMNDNYINSRKEALYKSIFGTDKSTGQGSMKYQSMDFGGNVAKGYAAWREELERLGYTLSELRQTNLGFEADIIPIDGKAITNAEEFRKALFGITTVPSENIGLLNKQITELETKISSLKSEISSLESSKNPPMKDVFQGDDKVNTNASTTAIKEESQALEQVSVSAKDAATSKEKFANANKEVKASADSSKVSISEEEKYFNSLGKSLTQYQNTLTSISRKPTDGNRSQELQEKIDIISSSIEKLNALKSKTEKDGYIFNKNDVDTGQKLEKIIKENIELVKQMSAAQKGSDADSRMKEIDKLTKYLDKNSRISKEAREQLEYYLALLKSGDPSVNVKEIHTAWTEVAVAEREAGREGKSFLDIFKDKAVYGFAAQLAGYYLSFMDLIRYARNAVGAVQELDTALIDLKKTTTMSSSELEQFYYDSNDIAKQMGVTTAEIINQASAWSRFNKIDPLYSNVY